MIVVPALLGITLYFLLTVNLWTVQARRRELWREVKLLRASERHVLSTLMDMPWWDDFVAAWHRIGLAHAAAQGDGTADLFFRVNVEANRRDTVWQEVYADLQHWERFRREWHFIGCQYAMECTLAQVRAAFGGTVWGLSNPVVGVERVVQALHAAGFVSDIGAQRAGGRLPS